MKEKEKKNNKKLKKPKTVKKTGIKAKSAADRTSGRAGKADSARNKGKSAPKGKIHDIPGAGGMADEVASEPLLFPDVSEPISNEPGQDVSVIVSDDSDEWGLEIVNEDGTVTFPDRGDSDGTHEGEEYLLFRFSGSGYSLRVTDVCEILRHQNITRVPGCAEHVIGLTSLRGAMVPVISLGSLMSVNNSTRPQDGRILMISGPDIMIGLLVEKRIEISRYNDDEMLSPVREPGSEGGNFVKGVLDMGGEFYSVLRPEAITGTKAIGRLNETEA